MQRASLRKRLEEAKTMRKQDLEAELSVEKGLADWSEDASF